jgi:hypothetical protein
MRMQTVSAKTTAPAVQQSGWWPESASRSESRDEKGAGGSATTQFGHNFSGIKVHSSRDEDGGSPGDSGGSDAGSTPQDAGAPDGGTPRHA